MLRLLVVAITVYIASTAPVSQQNAEEKTLVRTKRSEEAIVFGNHQNFARVKKGNLHPRPFPSETDDEMTANTEETAGPDDESADNTDADTMPVQPQGPEVDTLVEAAEPQPDEDEVTQINKLLKPDDEENVEQKGEDDESAQPEAEVDEEDRKDEHDEQKEEQEDMGHENQVQEQSNHYEDAKPDEEEEQLLEKLMEESTENDADNTSEAAKEEALKSQGILVPDPAKVVNLTPSQDSSGTSEAMMQNMDTQEGFNYLPDYYGLGPYFDTKDYQDSMPLSSAIFGSLREKRSAGAREEREAPVIATAEQMMVGGDSSTSNKAIGRVKRDLAISPEDLEAMLEEEYYNNANNIGPYDTPYYDPEEMFVERRGRPEVAEMSPIDMDPRSAPYDGGPLLLSDENSLEPEGIGPEERRRLELLEYLYNQEQESPYEAQFDYPGDLEESWQDLGPEREVLPEYPPDIYGPGQDDEEEPEQFNPNGLRQEEEAFFMPSKRQYMSFVPGVRKRDPPTFYPYQYGPDGRWGAMVSDPEREKRSELAEYQRLYQLAQALNGPSEDSGYRKRFDPEESSDYFDWSRK